MGKNYRNRSSTFRKPKRPFEKDRLDAEMKVVGEYGLKNKREVWRVQYVLSKMRSAARELLTKDEKDEDRIFHGEALLRRMVRYGLLLDSERKLDFVLGLTSSKLMERRLQTKVFKQGLASSILCSGSPPPSSWSAACKPRSSSRVSLSRSTTRASSSASATSASGARSATSPPSASGPTRRSTSTSRSPAPSRPAAAPAASPGSTPRLAAARAAT